MARLLFPLFGCALFLTTTGVSAVAQSPQTSPSQQSTPSPQGTPAAPPAQAPADLPDGPEAASQVRPPVTPTGPTALIDTTMGRLSCKLFSKQAPVTVANFVGLAQGTKAWSDPITHEPGKGDFYAGTTFHRVIPGFMVQGGDRAGDGTGDAGYYFQDEFDPSLAFDVPGRLAMANSGPNTNGSQFFVTEVPVMELTGRHTIFGQCDQHSVDLVRQMARVERNSSDKPLTPIVINKVTIVPDGQPIPPDPAAAAAAAPSAAKPASAPPAASH